MRGTRLSPPRGWSTTMPSRYTHALVAARGHTGAAEDGARHVERVRPGHHHLLARRPRGGASPAAPRTPRAARTAHPRARRRSDPRVPSPRASIRRNAHTTSRHGTLNDSRLHSSQATTPQRTQQLLRHRLGQLLVARREHAVVDRRRPEHLGPGQQRPPALADAGPDRRARGAPAAPTAGAPSGCASGRGRDSSERTAEKASAVTRPRATRSHSPSSTSAGSRPVSGASSGRKQAPRHAQGGEHVGRRTDLGLGRGRTGPHGAQHRLEVVAHDEGERRGRRRRRRCARSARPAA